MDYDPLAGAYARHRRIDEAVLDALVAGPLLSSSSRAVEIGCGTGNYVIALREATRSSCFGVDPSREMASLARGRDGGVAVVVASAESLPFGDETFDFSFSVDVVHHIQDRRAYVSEAFRVLREGGSFCTATEDEWNIRHRHPLATYFPETVSAELRRYPAVPELRSTMERMGFKNLRETRVASSCRMADARAYRDKAFSSLHLIPEDAFQRGVDRMERDLRAGPITAVVRHLLLWATKPGTGRGK